MKRSAESFSGTDTTSFSRLVSNRVVLLVFLFMGGVLSVYRGKDVNFDLLNYHFYDAWAFFHSRWNVDLYPAQLQTFLTPFIDLPFFVLQHLFPDYVVVFTMGLPVGLGGYFVWRALGAGTEAVDEKTAGIRQINRIAAAILAVVGAAGFGQAGTTMGEWVPTPLALAAIWAFISLNRGSLSETKAALISGACLGLAAGLKLTAAVPAIAAAVAFPWLLNWRKPGSAIRAYVYFALAGIISALVVAGPWMWFLYHRFHNPLFPFFNEIFPSPLLSNGSINDRRFVPHSFFEVLTFPVQAFFVKNFLHTEMPMRDPRLLIGALISIWWLVSNIYLAAKRKVFSSSARLKCTLATTFMVFYVVWMFAFGIYRYAIALECLAIIMVALAIDSLLRQRHFGDASVFAAVTYGSAILLTSPIEMGHIDMTGGPFFAVNLPTAPENSVAISLTSQPASFLAPLWPGHPAFVSGISNFSWPGVNEPIQRQVAAKVASATGRKYVVMARGPVTREAQFLLSRYDLAIDQASCSVPFREQADLIVCETKPNAALNAIGFDASDPSTLSQSLGIYQSFGGTEKMAWTGRFAHITVPRRALIKGKVLVVEGYAPISIYKKYTKYFKNVESAKVSIFVDGKQVDAESIEPYGTFTARIPADKVISASSGLVSVMVEVRSPYGFIPKNIGLSADGRLLGIQLSRVTVEQ